MAETADFIYVEPAMKCELGLNRNFCSSCLFLAPAIYGYLIAYPAVMVGSIICFLTSTAHHYTKCQNQLLRKIDIVCVNSIAIYFILHCVFTIGSTFYANLMYLFAACAVVAFAYFSRRPHLYADYYCIVHFLAITGILCYIRAYELSHVTGN